jgi:aryl-alcohol dehydrogenase-like predicted oxidoreductase
MTTVTLGKTGITVNKNGFGALPIQNHEGRGRKAFEKGI